MRFTDAQIRDARVLLRWSAEGLANATLGGVATVSRAETGDGAASLTCDPATKEAMLGNFNWSPDWRRAGDAASVGPSISASGSGILISSYSSIELTFDTQCSGSNGADRSWRAIPPLGDC